MDKLTISKIFFSKISPITNRISSVKLIDLGLSGGFGSVYKSVIANNEFAVKVFHDSSDTHGYTTINNLIDKINDYEINSSESLKLVASLQALPLFSFEGKLKGKAVKGYVTYFLNHNEYMSFDEILANKKNEYNQLGLDERLYLAEQLCKGVQGLEKLTYIHADINAQNILINLKNLDLVLIDFDSGAITDGNNNVPSTWGKPNEWIAPEIRKQIDDKNNSITINIHSDRFSVIVGIHYLIFIQSPYCFLKNMSEQTMTSYFNKYKWPNIPQKKEKYFNKVCPVHSKVVAIIQKKVPNLLIALQTGLNDGYFNINQRVTYSQLLIRLKNNYSTPPPKSKIGNIWIYLFVLITVMYILFLSKVFESDNSINSPKSPLKSYSTSSTPIKKVKNNIDNKIATIPKSQSKLAFNHIEKIKHVKEDIVENNKDISNIKRTFYAANKGEIFIESKKLEGNLLELKVTMKNFTKNTSGILSLSFPQISSKKMIDKPNNNGFKKVTSYGRGEKIYNIKSKKNIKGKYLLVEGESSTWYKNSNKSFSIILQIPKGIESLNIYLRGSYSNKVKGIQVFPDDRDYSTIYGQQSFRNYRVNIPIDSSKYVEQSYLFNYEGSKSEVNYIENDNIKEVYQPEEEIIYPSEYSNSEVNYIENDNLEEETTYLSEPINEGVTSPVEYSNSDALGKLIGGSNAPDNLGKRLNP
jgi:serine/threonine protein kinase